MIYTSYVYVIYSEYNITVNKLSLVVSDISHTGYIYV